MPAPLVPAAEAARQRARRKRLRRRILVGVFVLPLLLLATAIYVAFGPKPPPPPIVLPVSPHQAASAARRIDAVRQALTQPLPPPPPTPTSQARPKSEAPSAPLPMSSAPPSPVQVRREPNGADAVTLRVSQSDVNAYLASDPKSIALLRAHGVHAVSINFDPPNQITIHAAADFHGMSGNGVVHADIVPDPQTGVRVNITDARFGRLPPSVLTATANSIVARILHSKRPPGGLQIHTASIVGTELVLTGMRSPAK